jgi:hypothetical protein
MHQHNHQLVRQRWLLDRYRHHHIGVADVSTIQNKNHVEEEDRSDDCVCPRRLVSTQCLDSVAEGAK